MDLNMVRSPSEIGLGYCVSEISSLFRQLLGFCVVSLSLVVVLGVGLLSTPPRQAPNQVQVRVR